MATALSIVGNSESGKTTLILRLITWYKEKGVTVGTIKHTHHPLAADPRGKDSERFSDAGAAASMVIGSDRFIYARQGEFADPVAIAKTYFSDLDILIVEGFKKGPLPKIEVYRSDSGVKPLYPGLTDVRALVTDTPVSGIRCFRPDAVEAIGEFILREALPL